MNFLVQFTKIAILQGACAQLLLGGIHRCGHFSGAFQMTYFFRRVWAAPGGNRAAWGVSRCGVFCGPYFPVFGVDAGICSVGLRIRSGCWGGGGADRGGPVFGHFSRSVIGAVFYSARSGFNPTRSLSIFSENIKIFSENIKKLVVI